MLNFKTTAKYIAATSVLCLTVGAITPAYAINSAVDVVELTIDGSELETERGISRVYASLQSRAEAECESPGVKPIEFSRMEAECTTRLLEDFVADVDHEKLSDYHRTAVQKDS